MVREALGPAEGLDGIAQANPPVAWTLAKTVNRFLQAVDRASGATGVSTSDGTNKDFGGNGSIQEGGVEINLAQLMVEVSG